MIHPDFNDILITPAVTSTIRSRSEVNIYNTTISKSNTWLPLIVSPMDTVIDKNNWKLFIYQKMPICFPRGIKPPSEIDIQPDFNEDDSLLIDSYKSVIFFSYSLDEIGDILKGLVVRQGINSNYDIKYNILIDIANGHISHLVDLLKELRSRTSVKIMVGNIANPETYKVLSDAGADYIRCGIGFGGGCLTAKNTAIGYSMASLINQCSIIKKEENCRALIVADGGFREYSDIIKALALGADFVMLGSTLNKTIESAGDSYWRGIKLNNKLSKFLWKKGFKIEKKFRGMSTKEVQKKWGKKKLTTSEGVVRMRTVKYTLSGWRENFEDYLKSSMSYTNSRTLDKFIGDVKWTIISQNSFERFNK